MNSIFQTLPAFNGLSIEIIILVGGCALGLVHFFIQAYGSAAERGIGWALGTRDEVKTLSVFAQRLERTSINFKETFPIAIALLLAIELMQQSSLVTQYASIVWLSARIIYLPAYVFGSSLRPYLWGAALFSLVALGVSLFYNNF
jgi:uncharacterized MAPEG superfamily protein